MAEAAAKTGIGPIATVAIEQYFPKEQRIIEDNLAYKILPAGMRAFVRLVKTESIRNWMIRSAEKDIPGVWGGLMCRKRYIDEKLADSIKQIKAVVNLGAGFDTRAYRLPFLSDFPVWEVDQIENIKLKQARIRKVIGEIPVHIKLVAIDFDCEKINPVLESSGYSINQKTFFIMEAVTQYLTEDGIKSTFTFLSSAVTGSRLVFTYVRKDFLDGQQFYGWEKGYKKYVTKDKIWIFGMNPENWPDFLNQFGWEIIEDIDFLELHEKYVRPTRRSLASTPIERIIYAEKK
jgi:methyltransferase (TIGR00027 family)